MFRRGRTQTMVAVLVAGAVLAGACGGSSKKNKTAVDAATTSTTSVSESTTSTSTVAESTVPGQTTTTAKSGTAVTSASGVKSTTTVKRAGNTATTPKPVNIGASIINATTTSSTAPRTDIQAGGTMTKLMTSDFTGLDPILTSASTLDGAPMFAVFDTLLYDQRDGSIVPQMAEAMTSTDGSVWLLKLRANVKFTDGTPVDAAAVKYNVDRSAAPANVATQATSTKNIASMEIPDPLTLKITLKTKDAQFPRSFVNLSFIGSPTAIDKQGKDNFGQNPVGAGPFIFKSWTHGSTMTVERNPNYWNAPRPYLDRIVFKFIGDEQQRINAFKAGEGNEIQLTTPESADQVAKAGGQGVAATLSGGPTLEFNLTKAPLDDIRIRQAIYYGTDLKEFAQTIHGGTVPALDSVFQNQSPLYDKNQLQPGYDPVKAQALITDYSKTVLGGAKVNITLLVFNLQFYRDAAQLFAAQLNRLKDINITLDVQSTQSVVTKVLGRDYQFATFSNPFNDPDPKWGNSFVSNANPSPTGWKNAQYDADIADAKATLDPAKRIADFRDALKQWYTDFPTMYFDHGTYYTYGAPNLQDIDASGNGMDLIDRMWIKSHG